MEVILNIIKGLFYYKLYTLKSKRIIINILCNILFIFTLISFKAIILLYTFILFKALLAKVAKYFIITPDMAVEELIGLKESIGAANLI